MNTANWLSRNVSRLLPVASSKQKEVSARDTRANEANEAANVEAGVASKGKLPPRSISMRLGAALRQEGEALSPRLLRRALQ